MKNVKCCRSGALIINFEHIQRNINLILAYFLQFPVSRFLIPRPTQIYLCLNVLSGLTGEIFRVFHSVECF